MLEGATRSAACFFELRLDGVPEIHFQGHPVEAVDLLQAGGRGDVDLGEEVADDVDAGEDQAARFQRRTDGLADLLLPRADRVACMPKGGALF